MKSKLFILILVIVIILSGCVTWEQKALNNGYIKADDCPTLEIPERIPLPHPSLATVDIESAFIFDDEGNVMGIDEYGLMVAYTELFGSIEKFKVLVEIYEREYLNAGGKVSPELTLEELKAEYKKRLGIVEQTIEDNYLNTGAVEKQMTVGEFADIVDLYNTIKE